jgi:phosphate-selective porin OprO/OprP
MSAKGDSQLKVGGYMHSDGRFYLDDTGNRGTDAFVLRRVRPFLQGTVFKFIDFHLLPDFGEGKAALQDAYLEIRYFPKASLRAGKSKTPFGLGRLQSATDIQFVERGLPTGLVPNRDLGIQLSGDLAKKRLNYAIGVFNGTLDGGSVDGDTNDGKDYVARLFATPFQDSRSDHPLKNLGFGIAGSTGKQEGALPSYKTPGQLVYFSYATGVSATLIISPAKSNKRRSSMKSAARATIRRSNKIATNLSERMPV